MLCYPSILEIFCARVRVSDSVEQKVERKE